MCGGLRGATSSPPHMGIYRSAVCLCWPGPWHDTPSSRFAEYRKTSNIRRTLVANKIVNHSDVVGASPVGAAPTTSSFST